MGLSSVLDIAKTALLTSQAQIQTTSHNIANVNTPNYTRQRLNISAGVPVVGGGNYLGTGVTADYVERVYDKFLGMQIYDAAESRGRYTGMKDSLSRLEGIFNDSKGLGLEDALNGFFNAINDVANDASSYSARTALIGKAGFLADRINSLDTRLTDEINNIESQIKGEVTDINSLASRIAALNGKIQPLETDKQKANDLRDQREGLIKELAEKIDITVLEEESGRVAILAAGGNLLVGGTSTVALSVSANADNNNYYDVKIGSTKISSSISSGKLKGLLSVRDSDFQGALNKLEILSASITKEINVLHRAGYGLDSSTGNNFFTALSPDITAKSTNNGNASATASVLTLSSLTLDNYEIRFNSTSSFNIVNTTDDTVVSSGSAYTSGANIDFDGLRVVITNGTTTPQSGDTYSVSVTKNASMNFSVSLTDPNKFAAAQATTGLPGGNTNAIAMINRADAKVLSGSTATFSSYYSSMVAAIGVASNEASVNSDAQDVIVSELESYRESVSGVSMDEEAANLVKYQYAYQAAAKVINVVDTMFDSLMSLK